MNRLRELFICAQQQGILINLDKVSDYYLPVRIAENYLTIIRLTEIFDEEIDLELGN
ncbi:hypothetical protein LCGC14_1858480 [marine sediment metagenome]|uniref:Uncharacterized protein n=1 Tax=marine sediment metagenome TaxID=412755 RepID=A0A0F9G8H3_9ZZZZ